MRTMISSGNQPVHIESVDTHRGSPDDLMANLLDRKPRATRHSPTGVSNDDRYDLTGSGAWVDGSPLPNVGVDWAPENEPDVGATHNMQT
jgi:hypothetical protein